MSTAQPIRREGRSPARSQNPYQAQILIDSYTVDHVLCGDARELPFPREEDLTRTVTLGVLVLDRRGPAAVLAEEDTHVSRELRAHGWQVLAAHRTPSIQQFELGGRTAPGDPRQRWELILYHPGEVPGDTLSQAVSDHRLSSCEDPYKKMSEAGRYPHATVRVVPSAEAAAYLDMLAERITGGDVYGAHRVFGGLRKFAEPGPVKMPGAYLCPVAGFEELCEMVAETYSREPFKIAAREVSVRLLDTSAELLPKDTPNLPTEVSRRLLASQLIGADDTYVGELHEAVEAITG